METIANPAVDLSDPLVAAIAWVLTGIVGALVKKKPNLERFRHLLPLVALGIAVFLRGAEDVIVGQPITAETVLRGMAAGAMAVVMHAQLREAKKLKQGEKLDEA